MIPVKLLSKKYNAQLLAPEQLRGQGSGAEWRTVLLLLAGVASAGSQFSPGPLSKAHAFLNGPTHCTDCHALAAGARGLKCLGCHTEIRQRLDQRRGLHHALLKNQTDDCAPCHSEHNGERFIPTRWGGRLKEFDHRQTGYPLGGRHALLPCNRCHTPERVSQAARPTIVLKDLRRTYLGLSRECLSCHPDPHRGELGQDCGRCHTFLEWKRVITPSRPAAGFVHAIPIYRGAHAGKWSKCDNCHKNPSNYTIYSCRDCHAHSQTILDHKHRRVGKYVSGSANCLACHP